MLRPDINQDRLRRFLVVGMRGTVAVCEHLHPGMAIVDQALAERFTDGVARTNDALDALPDE